jgi:hypothetical protein
MVGRACFLSWRGGAVWMACGSAIDRGVRALRWNIAFADTRRSEEVIESALRPIEAPDTIG